VTARGMAAVRTMCAIKRQSRFISDWRRLSGGDTMLTTLAWVYTVGFVGVFLITHAPGFTDADGFLFGLFKIDPIDDVVHLLSGLVGAVVALRARNWIRTYLLWVGILYGLDAVIGLTQSRGLLDLSIFMQGMGTPDFSGKNFAVNLPHIVLAGIALVFGFRKSLTPARSAA